MRLWRDSAANRKASSENRKVSSENQKVFTEESEGFFRRALGSYTHKFPKRGAASLTYLPRSHLDLPCSRLGLSRHPWMKRRLLRSEGASGFQRAFNHHVIFPAPQTVLVKVTYSHHSDTFIIKNRLSWKARIQHILNLTDAGGGGSSFMRQSALPRGLVRAQAICIAFLMAHK